MKPMELDSALALIATLGDPELAADQFGGMLVRMNPFDAVRAAAIAALHPDAGVRRALATALAAPLRLVGDDLVLDHLALDGDVDVRGAAQDARLARGYVIAR